MIKLKNIQVCALIVLLGSFSNNIFAQNVFGNAKGLIGKQIFLSYYNGLNKENIHSTIVDQNGNFKLSYDSTNYGIAILTSGANDELQLILNHKNIKIETNELGFYNVQDITEGIETKLLNEYKSLYYKSDQLISAWMYLQNMYKNDPYWLDTLKSNMIGKEIQFIQSFENNITKDLDKTSYLNYYISIFKLINTTPYLVNYNKQKISSELVKYRKINLLDDKIWKSGLYASFLESYFFLIENSSKDFEAVSMEMKKSIDMIIVQLIEDEIKFKEITNFLINFFNKKSFREENDYLMDAMLKQTSCMLSEDLQSNLNRFKQFYIGEKAPGIEFSKFKNPNYNSVKPVNNLKDVSTNFKLIVFGSSKCHKCIDEIPLLEEVHSNFHPNNFLEIIFISLDDNLDDFMFFTQNFSFPSVCTLEKWETPVAKDYLVQYTPSMFLLDKDLKIVLKPNSVNHLKSWLTKHYK